MKPVNSFAALRAAGIGLVAAVGLITTSVAATADDSFATGNLPTANPRAGIQDNALAGGLDETSVAWGALPLANPDTATGITRYGYNTSNGGTLTQDPHEAFKTEPDKNVYLVLDGHHYLFQGHEGGPQGYVTRIDLDQPDPAQRVSLVSDQDVAGQPLPTFDGITWDPFSRQLLLTAESTYPTGGVWAIPLDGSGNATDGANRLMALGSGGYEGIQNDSDGNVWLVEDVGGSGVSGGKKPNSYVYRFTPADVTDLTVGGTLEALRVYRSGNTPVTASELQNNPSDPFIQRLHTYGSSFTTDWVTVNEGDGSGDVNGAGFNATQRSREAGATPFKRPENGVFRPGTDFREFYFTETGDTSAASTLPGAYGGVFALRQADPSAAQGLLSPVTLGDESHTGFDNLAFAARNQLLVVEDAGDKLHTQRDALDSGYVIDLSTAKSPQHPTRWLAEGRDPSATYDALFSPGYNDGDNEVTGIHVSDGDATSTGILGAKLPTPFSDGWRVFWTQQHGDNMTWEVGRSGSGR